MTPPPVPTPFPICTTIISRAGHVPIRGRSSLPSPARHDGGDVRSPWAELYGLATGAMVNSIGYVIRLGDSAGQGGRWHRRYQKSRRKRPAYATGGNSDTAYRHRKHRAIKPTGWATARHLLGAAVSRMATPRRSARPDLRRSAEPFDPFPRLSATLPDRHGGRFATYSVDRHVQQCIVGERNRRWRLGQNNCLRGTEILPAQAVFGACVAGGEFTR